MSGDRSARGLREGRSYRKSYSVGAMPCVHGRNRDTASAAPPHVWTARSPAEGVEAGTLTVDNRSDGRGFRRPDHRLLSVSWTSTAEGSLPIKIGGNAFGNEGSDAIWNT